MNAVEPWKHQNSIIEACNASYSRSDQQIHGTCRQAADHSNSAMEAQASSSYPAAAAAAPFCLHDQFYVASLSTSALYVFQLLDRVLYSIVHTIIPLHRKVVIVLVLYCSVD